MDLKDCIEFANKNPVCWLATAEGDQPRVRGFLLWYTDEEESEK
jgi:pyridoxamine 5'-phosphate oxidase